MIKIKKKKRWEQHKQEETVSGREASADSLLLSQEHLGDVIVKAVAGMVKGSVSTWC